jgi:limonene-1,2-epoxide hydrolase
VISDNEATVRDFIAAWSRLEVDELVGFFTSDGVYHNMPMGPVAGRENLRGFIAGFLKGWTSTNWEVLTLIGRGDIVVAERVDRTMVGDKPVDLPCCGVFQLEGGKIKVWRDYFDLGTYRTALGA